MEKRETFICACHSLDHQYSLHYDKEINHLSFEPHLYNGGRWYNRFWLGVKYAFGFNSIYGHWDDVIINNDNIPKLIEILERVDTEDKKRIKENKQA